MSRKLLSKLGPATHRVLAAALIHEREFGKPMGASMLRRLCEAEGASYTACLAVVRGQGLQQGEPIKVGTPGSAIAVPDDETEAALDWRERIDPS